MNGQTARLELDKSWSRSTEMCVREISLEPKTHRGFPANQPRLKFVACDGHRLTAKSVNSTSMYVACCTIKLELLTA
jgi:hypothetical protein